MALIQKYITAPPLHKSQKTSASENAETEKANLVADADAQDEERWQSEFANSQDTLSLLAARSRAHQAAGRTKKVGS